MIGSLSEINVSDLVAQLYTVKRSGILRLSQGEVKKSIYFKEGSIVFAHSNLKHERLGEILLRLGKITEDELKSVEGQLKSGMRLGRALHEKGFLAPAEVTAGVSYQIQMIVYSVFNWDSGEYEFLDRERPVFEDIMVEGSTPLMVIDGIRNITNFQVLDRAIQDLEDKVVSQNTGSKRLRRTNLDFSEETILACIDGKTTAGQLRSVSRLNPVEFGRALYCLSISGMVQFGGYDGLETKIRAQVASRWRGTPFHTEPMPAEDGDQPPPRRMKTFTEPELRKLIADTHAKFKEATDEEVLGVLPDALPDEIQEAYDRCTEVFHPPYYSFDRYRDVKEPLKIIIDRITEAHHNLMERVGAQKPLLAQELSRPVVVTPAEEAPEPPPVPPPAPPEPAAAVPPEVPVQPAPSAAPTITALQEALAQQPANTGLMRELGILLQQSGRAKEGEKQLLRALEIEPQSLENHFALASFYQNQGLKFKAFKHLNIVLQLDPQNQKAMESLGIKKRKGGLYEITN